MIHRRDVIERLRAHLARLRRQHEDELARFARLKARQPQLRERIAESARRAARLNVMVNELERRLAAPRGDKKDAASPEG